VELGVETSEIVEAYGAPEQVLVNDRRKPDVALNAVIHGEPHHNASEPGTFLPAKGEPLRLKAWTHPTKSFPVSPFIIASQD
jgi:hypothetical protein